MHIAKELLLLWRIKVMDHQRRNDSADRPRRTAPVGRSEVELGGLKSVAVVHELSPGMIEHRGRAIIAVDRGLWELLEQRACQETRAAAQLEDVEGLIAGWNQGAQGRQLLFAIRHEIAAIIDKDA
jgi:hypothetical protein